MKLSNLLKKEVVLCILVSFFFCAFLPVLPGLLCASILSMCNLLYTRVLNIYNLIGFGVGWGFAVLQHWIY